jgi:hypothetical protein
VSNEVEVLTCAGSHPNLVPFRGWFVDSAGVLCLLLGHCEGGTLAALLKVRQVAGYLAARLLSKATGLALHHVHSLGLHAACVLLPRVLVVVFVPKFMLLCGTVFLAEPRWWCRAGPV